MNPLCKCGCGLEVSLPWNKWISGHATVRKLTIAQVKEIKSLLGEVSQYELARRYGVSQSTISTLSWQRDGYKNRSVPHSRKKRAIRLEEIEDLKNIRKVRQTMSQIRSMLRERQR